MVKREIMQRFHSLCPEEAFVLLEKGTESPFSGKYESANRIGIYLCKQCDLPLFCSENQFFCGCGWPAFDQPLPNAVVTTLDQDLERTEVLCRRCAGHLGHVFTNEGWTKTNLRYCINSIALQLIEAYRENKEKAVYAAGCFWGVEYRLQTIPGVINTLVGYTCGHVVNPTYEEVCQKNTGHVEAVSVEFSPQQISYKKLTQHFFSIHDPTQTNGQGVDIGQQYLSCIFYFSKTQQRIARTVALDLEKKGVNVATKIQPASLFYPAENYHQKYYEKKR